MNFPAAFLTILSCGIPLIAGQSLDEYFNARLAALNEATCRQNSKNATSYSHLLKLFNNAQRCVAWIMGETDVKCPVEVIMLCHQQVIEVAASCLPGNRKSNELILRNGFRQYIPAKCSAQDSTNCVGLNAEQGIMQCNMPVLKLDQVISNLNASECRALMDNKQCMATFMQSCPQFAPFVALIYDIVYSENECAKYAVERNAEN